MGRRLERGLRGSLGGLAALLAASILTLSFLPSQTQGTGNNYISITLEPSYPQVGGNVSLTPGGKPRFKFCIWNRRYTVTGNWIFMYFPPPDPYQNNGPGYTGRETSDPKCSLHIRNLTRWDAGHYEVRKMGQRDTATEIGETNLTFSRPYKVSNTWITWSVVGTLIGATLIGALLYCGFCLYTRRRSQRASKSSPLQSVPENTSTV